MRQAGPRFKKGVYLGIRGMSNDVVIGDLEAKDVVTSRAIRRLPDDETWGLQHVGSIKGTPWDHKGTRAADDSTARGEDGGR